MIAPLACPVPAIDRPTRTPDSFADDADGEDFESFSSTADDDGDGDWSGMVEAADPGLDVHDAIQPQADESGGLPRELQRRIERDVAEVRLLRSFRASDISWGGGQRISLRVGFPVASLGMNAEQVRAWSLHNDLLLLAELRLPSHYFNTKAFHIQVTVGTATSATAHSTLNPLTKCKLSWIIESRIKRLFLQHLDPSHVPEPAFDLDSAAAVASACDCALPTAIHALVDAKGDVSTAILRIRPESEPSSGVSACWRLTSPHVRSLSYERSQSLHRCCSLLPPLCCWPLMMHRPPSRATKPHSAPTEVPSDASERRSPRKRAAGPSPSHERARAAASVTRLPSPSSSTNTTTPSPLVLLLPMSRRS